MSSWSEEAKQVEEDCAGTKFCMECPFAKLHGREPTGDDCPCDELNAVCAATCGEKEGCYEED